MARDEEEGRPGADGLVPPAAPLTTRRAAHLLASSLCVASGVARAGAEEERAIPIVRLDSGVKFEELSPMRSSEGADVRVESGGDVVTFDYVLRRDNGYFVYSTIEGVSFQPRDLPVGPVGPVPLSELIPGLAEVMLANGGMRAGDRRRALIPAAYAYAQQQEVKLLPQPPGYSAQRQLLVHRAEPFLFEVDVLKVRRR